MATPYAKCVSDLLQRWSESPSISTARHQPTLRPMLLLCERMKNPQTNYKCIHISGRNGKGSTATKLAASLSLCGYRVGLFTSPHISSIRERICVAGRMISKADFVNDFFKILHYENEINMKNKLTYSELLSAMAFYHFKRIGVDFAVIEVDIGGEYDATNIIKHPLLSVIVSGNCIDAIGIIKPGRPVVIGPTVPYKLTKSYADECGSDLYQMRADEHNGFDTYDEYNSNLARYALEVLNCKYFILPKNTNELLQALTIGCACRMEIINIHLYKLFKQLLGHSKKAKKLLTNTNRKWLKKFISEGIYNKYNKHCAVNEINVIFDVAHNCDAFKQLFKSLTKTYSPLQYSYRVVLGLEANIDQKMMNYCDIIAEYADFIHLISIDVNKYKEFGMDVKQLKRILIQQCKYDEHKICVKGNGDIFMELMYALDGCYLHNNSKKELNSMPLLEASSTDSSEKEQKKGVNNNYKTEIMIITGSFYVMSDARKSLGLRYEDDFDGR